jgi:hypothetical protein
MARPQLGASLTPESSQNRGILILEPRSKWQTFTTKGTDAPWLFSESVCAYSCDGHALAK